MSDMDDMFGGGNVIKPPNLPRSMKAGAIMDDMFGGKENAVHSSRPNLDPRQMAEQEYIKEIFKRARSIDGFGGQRSFGNPNMGIGGSNDIINNTYLNIPKSYTKAHLMATYINSWVAAKIIDLLVDDVFSAGLIRKDEIAEDDKLVMMEKDLCLWEKLPNAVKAGRLFGTAFLIFAPANGNFARPLDPETTQEGDISNLIVVDRFSMEVNDIIVNPSDKMYGKPNSYVWTISHTGKPRYGMQTGWSGSTIVHSSRCVRFDGIGPLTKEGWEFPTHKEWGYSILTRVMDDILLDMLLSATGGDVAKRFAVPVMYIKNFRDILANGGIVGDEVGPDTYAASMKSNIAVNRMAFVDATDKLESLEVGNPEAIVKICENQVKRLANAAGVPVTRFTGESASGLNATGSGDARDYRMAVESYRERDIDPNMKFIMDVMARNAGLEETPEWSWGRLGEMTAKEQSETLKETAESISLLVSTGLLDKSEARETLNQLDNINIDPTYTPPDPPMLSQSVAASVIGKSPTTNPISNATKKPPLDNDM